LRENKDYGNKFDSDISEQRINYRVKCEEVERLRIDYEDTANELKSYKAQNEMLKDKISILRSEFFKAEAKGKEDGAEMKSKIVSVF
jgi:progesterone-induced-blocking factor 1